MYIPLSMSFFMSFCVLLLPSSMRSNPFTFAATLPSMRLSASSGVILLIAALDVPYGDAAALQEAHYHRSHGVPERTLSILHI